MFLLCSFVLFFQGFVQAERLACPGNVHANSGCGGPGAVVFNVTDAAACCEKCGGYSCSTWTFGPHPVVDANYPPHNCAIMSTYQPPRKVDSHSCGVMMPAPPPAPKHPTPAPGPSAYPPCNADISCNVVHGPDWRCTADKSTSGPEANCHLAGPGTAGNATCSCKPKGCSITKVGKKTAGAKQYLMIGDSISLGMKSNVFNNLTAHGIQGTHSPGNAASVNLGAHCIADWIKTPNADVDVWDLISFQFGLHDIAFDVERISVEQYTQLLTNATADLVAAQKQHGTKLLWVKTTPVPTVPTYSVAGPCNETSKCLNPPRFDSDVVLYNEAADKVMAAFNAQGASIGTLDLYSYVLNKCGGTGYANCTGFQLPSNVHYTSDGWAALGAVMSEAVSNMK